MLPAILKREATLMVTTEVYAGHIVQLSLNIGRISPLDPEEHWKRVCYFGQYLQLIFTKQIVHSNAKRVCRLIPAYLSGMPLPY